MPLLAGCKYIAMQFYSQSIELSESGYFGEAIFEISKVIKLDPDLSEAYNELGYAYDSSMRTIKRSLTILLQSNLIRNIQLPISTGHMSSNIMRNM
jgi:hypothetical protein